MISARAVLAASLVLSGRAFGAETDAAAVRARVHTEVRAMLQADKGHVLFTDLWNGSRLGPAEKEYAARLYEVFFALPGHVQDEMKATGQAPKRAAIAANFGLAPEAVELLLAVATSEPRMPKLFRVDPGAGEIVDVDAAALRTFGETRGSPVRVSGWEGKPLPEFSLPALAGGQLASAELQGSPVLLWVWLTRCPVCRRVTPSMVELDRRLGPKGLRVVGLNSDAVLGLDVTDADREAWLREQAVRYPNAALDAATRAAFGQNIFPAFFLVGRDGRVRQLILNERSLEELEKLVLPLLAGASHRRFYGANSLAQRASLLATAGRGEKRR
jgi:thiol-disulfide isomerase/thioredoxin